MKLPAILRVKCHYCSHFRHPREVLLMTGGPIMCWHCYEGHQNALKMLAGTPPPGCQVCGLTFQKLRESALGGDIRMYMHWKDGLYQVLCRTCSDNYVPKRVDLYGHTVFGHKLKLTG